MRDRAIDRAKAGMTSALRAPPHAHGPASIVDGDETSIRSPLVVEKLA
jgi:hypothetical protein